MTKIFLVDELLDLLLTDKVKLFIKNDLNDYKFIKIYYKDEMEKGPIHILPLCSFVMNPIKTNDMINYATKKLEADWFSIFLYLEITYYNYGCYNLNLIQKFQ